MEPQIFINLQADRNIETTKAHDHVGNVHGQGASNNQDTNTKASFLRRRRNRKKQSQRILPHEWLRRRELICSLYIEDDRTLDEVLDVLKTDVFHASRRQLVSQLRKWGMRKNRPPGPLSSVDSSLQKATTLDTHTAQTPTNNEFNAQTVEKTSDQPDGVLESTTNSFYFDDVWDQSMWQHFDQIVGVRDLADTEA